MKNNNTTQPAPKPELIGFKVLEDCMLDATNFEEGEEILIHEHGEDNDWKGIVWFEQYPQLFAPMYDKETDLTALISEGAKHGNLYSKIDYETGTVIIENNKGKWIASTGDALAPSSEEDATYICKAVNLHDELVEALDKATRCLRSFEDAEIWWKEDGEVLNFISKVLTKAKTIKP